MQAALELIAARVEGDRLRFAVARRACATAADPDAIAQEGMDQLFPGLSLERVVLLPTSWRYEDGILTLTYLGYSDDLPLGALPLALAPGATADGDDAEAVVAHAVRHLAFLLRQDPQQYGRSLGPDARAYLARVEPGVAGRIYRERAA